MRFKKLDLNLLVALDALLTEKNVTRAGERVFLSQSTMSNALSRLRQYFDDELLVQVGGRMELTPRAELLHEAVRDVLVRIDTTVAAQPAFDPMASDREFTLFVSDYSMEVLVPGMLALAHQRGSQVRFSFKPQVSQPYRHLERGEADLLIMGDAQLEDWRPMLRHLPCPLLVVRRMTAPAIFAGALGAGAEDAPHRLLNMVVLEHLQGLAPAFKGRALVLSALPNPTELVPLMGDAYAASYVATDLEQTYRDGLHKQVAGFAMTADQVKVLPGRPEVALPELVRQEHVDCLLLGTVARSGFAAFWLGNTAEDVLPRVDCDVLVLRPQDYVEPV